MADFEHPQYTIIGELDKRSGDQVVQLYKDFQAPIYRVPLGVAEMIKYASNAFHAAKVTFANEMGRVCEAYGVDSEQVMDVFTQDHKLNISPKYLKPGFAFGGPCLGKDLRALLYGACQQDVDIPALASLLESNQQQVQNIVDLVLRV